MLRYKVVFSRCIGLEKDIFIGIDLGSSGVRIEVYDIDGNLIAEGREAISKQDVDEWLMAIAKAMPRAISEYRGYRKHVVIDSTSGTFIAVDAYGRPLLKPVMYYEKAVDIWDKVKGLSSIKDIGMRGVTIDAASPLVKILDIRERKPDIYRKIKWIIPASTWISYRLCFSEGEIWRDIYTDYTNALKFGLDITSSPPQWYKPLFDDLGIDLEIMPKPIGCGEYMCTARGDYASILGLEGAEVYHGMTDGNASALAGGALKIGDTNIYTGSTTVPKFVTDKLIPHPALYYHIHPINGYLAGSATGFTGYILSWFTEKVFGINISEAFNYISIVEPGSEYIFFPPGDRGPFYDTALNPAIVDIKIYDDTREKIIGRFLRSIVLGITLLEYTYIKLFEELFNTKINTVRLTGGGSKSKIWNIIRASIYEKKVEIFGDRVAIGAIIPILIKNKIYTNVIEIEKRFLKPLDIIEPDENLVKIYRAKMIKEKYLEKLKKLQELYRIA
ncbi:Carbohydrate kinase, FGGY [Ignisphaera aggregans DSM 17230]|uniref:Carbohydrate kinase, FGGY n=1 Tax=Ignisphaera aggregans (strain DSM 17230 / JCM 13409 / AQ1.S1) TaxID=583356 RepID=E0SRG4_IGNAA|nr:Carbohydrate kinase, FGGY [Ignisphaera aggregans DSM 17230]